MPDVDPKRRMIDAAPMRIMRRWLAAMLGIGLAFSAAAASRKVIIDQDAFDGTGLQPILMLLQDPAVEVLGITIVSGDDWAPEETATTLRMLELVGRTDVPVVQGAINPLVNSKERNRRSDPPFVPTVYNAAVHAVHPAVRGWQLNLQGFQRYQDVWLEP